MKNPGGGLYSIADLWLRHPTRDNPRHGHDITGRPGIFILDGAVSSRVSTTEQRGAGAGVATSNITAEAAGDVRINPTLRTPERRQSRHPASLKQRRDCRCAEDKNRHIFILQVQSDTADAALAPLPKPPARRGIPAETGRTGAFTVRLHATCRDEPLSAF